MAEVAIKEQQIAQTEQELATPIEEFRIRRDSITARYSAAHAQIKVSEALSGVYGVSDELARLGMAVERAQERTEHMQARVSAIDSLTELGILETPGQSLADLPALKPAHGGAVDALEERLAALKRELE